MKFLQLAGKPFVSGDNGREYILVADGDNVFAVDNSLKVTYCPNINAKKIRDYQEELHIFGKNLTWTEIKPEQP